MIRSKTYSRCELRNTRVASHCYLLQVDGANATADGSGPHGLAKPAYQFLAGVLAHLPALTPFLLASPNSYHRAVPSTWSGAYHVRPVSGVL